MLDLCCAQMACLPVLYLAMTRRPWSRCCHGIRSCRYRVWYTKQAHLRICLSWHSFTEEKSGRWSVDDHNSVLVETRLLHQPELPMQQRVVRTIHAEPWPSALPSQLLDFSLQCVSSTVQSTPSTSLKSIPTYQSRQRAALYHARHGQTLCGHLPRSQATLACSSRSE